MHLVGFTIEINICVAGPRSSVSIFEHFPTNKCELLSSGCHILDTRILLYIVALTSDKGQSQWPRGLRRGSVAARWMRLRGFNPPGGMDVCGEYCVVRWRSVRRADPTPRGVLPSVVCLSVIVKPR